MKTSGVAPCLLMIAWGTLDAGCSRAEMAKPVVAARGAEHGQAGCVGPACSSGGIASASPPTALSIASPAPVAPHPGPAVWRCTSKLPASDFTPGRPTKSLAGVEGVIQGPNAHRVWNEGMKGEPATDRLGTTLPSFVTRERAIAWTEHPMPANVTLVAARPWSGQSDRWVVVVSASAERADGPSRTDARLALVQVTPDARGGEPTVRRIARSMGPLSPRPQWGLLPEDLWPATCDAPCAIDDAANGLDDRSSLTALDFARYDLGPSNDLAFGVRTTMIEGYSGGFASFETLSLFRVDGETLTPVLDVPVGVEKLQAGDWNKDQSRQHVWFQADLVVEMRAHVDAVADVLLHAAGKRHSILFTWDPRQSAFVCR